MSDAQNFQQPQDDIINLRNILTIETQIFLLQEDFIDPTNSELIQ